MAAYHEYLWEETLYADTWGYPLTEKQARRLLKVLAKHFDIHFPIKVKFNKRNSGTGTTFDPRFGTPWIELCKSPSLGLLAHEFAHILTPRVTYSKTGQKPKQHHGPEFKDTVCNVQFFCRDVLLPRLKKQEKEVKNATATQSPNI